MSSQASRLAKSGPLAQRRFPSRPRIDVFVLPNLTTLLFVLIASVILVAVAAGLRQNVSVLGLLIAGGMVVLPLRDFLRQFERDLRSLGPLQLDSEAPCQDFNQEIEETAEALELHIRPHLLTTINSCAPVTIGTWRRRCLALGRLQSKRLCAVPASTRQALWLHELGHFASGDHWKVGLARSLLRTSVGFMTWSALFVLGIVLLALVYGLEVFEPGYLETLNLEPALYDLLSAFWPDPTAMAPLLDKARAIDPGLASLYVLDAHLPFVVSGFILWLFIWRKLVQVREFYADARAAAQIGSVETTWNALIETAEKTVQLPTGSPGGPSSRLSNLGRSFNKALPFHPTWAERFACLSEPSRVFGSWAWAGFTAGLTVLLLDLILVGPFTLGYLSSAPAHFGTLAGFVILGLWLLPGVCRGFSSSREMVSHLCRAVFLFLGIRAGWLLLNSILALALLVVAPDLLHNLLNATVLLGNKALTPPPVSPLPQSPATLVLWAVGSSWGLTLLMLLCLLAGLLVVGALLRRTLTWYAFPAGEKRLLRVSWITILVVALALGLLVLPPTTAIIQGDFWSFVQPLSLFAAAGAFLLSVAWGVWFFRTDQRYGRRCPACSEHVPGWFWVGKKCQNPGCAETLHPWLLADY